MGGGIESNDCSVPFFLKSYFSKHYPGLCAEHDERYSKIFGKKLIEAMKLRYNADRRLARRMIKANGTWHGLLVAGLVFCTLVPFGGIYTRLKRRFKG